MTERRTIDITPTWTGVMPGYLRVLESGTQEGKRLAREALMELARSVDAANKQAEED